MTGVPLSQSVQASTPNAPDSSESNRTSPRATSPALPLVQKAGDLEAIRTSVNDAATVSGGLWISYLFVMFYLTVAAGAVTHVDLFLERPVKLPFLGIDLPLLAFFCLAPLLFLIVHAYTLVHFVILSEKAKQFHQVLTEFDLAPQDGSPSRKIRNEMRDNLRRQLSINVFVQFLAGPPEIRAGAFGWTLRAISWISLVIGPILLLLLFQVQFLPYQSVAITWVHRLSIMVDFVLLWWLWRKILAGRDLDADRSAAPALAKALGMALTLLIVLFSCAIVVFTGEWQMRLFAGFKVLPNYSDPHRPLSIHEYIFNSTIDEISRKRIFPFSNTLILTNANIFETLGADDPAKLKKREFLYRARGRNFRGAIFDHAILPKVDFYGAHLEGASFLEVDLDQSSFDKASLNDSSLVRATARGTSFEDSELNGADLSGSNLEGADFVRASLNAASLSSSELSGAKFLGAKLSGANLSSASIFGASFNCANLSSAMLKNSAISGSYFVSARMEYANFSGANITASDFSNAGLAHTTATDTKPSKLFEESAATPAEASDAQALFDHAKIDDSQFQTNLADMFKAKICSYNFGNMFMLNSEVFNKLSGPRVPPMIDYILSGDCAAAAAWTAEDRDRLRARRDAPGAEPYRNKFLECSAFGP